MTAPSVVLNFIQAAGGDVEMLRSTECAYRFKVSKRGRGRAASLTNATPYALVLRGSGLVA